jgi:hypothetical protein
MFGTTKRGGQHKHGKRIAFLDEGGYHYDLR